VNLLNLSGHLDTALSVRNRSLAPYGNMFFSPVDSYIPLAQIVSGNLSVNYVIRVIVG